MTAARSAQSSSMAIYTSRVHKWNTTEQSPAGKCQSSDSKISRCRCGRELSFMAEKQLALSSTCTQLQQRQRHRHHHHRQHRHRWQEQPAEFRFSIINHHWKTNTRWIFQLELNFCIALYTGFGARHVIGLAECVKRTKVSNRLPPGIPSRGALQMCV